MTTKTNDKSANPMREFHVPVFCLKTRKLVVFRQQSTDASHACLAARKRFPNERVYAPFDAKPTTEELERLERLAHLPARERVRFAHLTGEL